MPVFIGCVPSLLIKVLPLNAPPEIKILNIHLSALKIISVHSIQCDERKVHDCTTAKLQQSKMLAFLTADQISFLTL